MNVCDGYGTFTREEIHGGEWCEVVAGTCDGCSACMRMLSGHQPWPTLISLGVKFIETRGWSTSFRGPIAIHAALKWPDMMTIPPLKRDGTPPERDAHNHRTWHVINTITDPAFHGPLPCNPKTGRQRRIPKASKAPTLFWPHDGPWERRRDDKPEFVHSEPLPLGAVVAVADLVDVLPMVEREWVSDGFIGTREDVLAILPSGHPAAPGLHVWQGGQYEGNVTDQFPYGDYRVGRFGWMLENIRRLPNPVPSKGFQGLRACPQDVAVQIAEQF